MVLTGENKIEKSVLINCSCGCGEGFEFKLCKEKDETDPFIWLSLVGDKFYTEQEHGWRRFCKKLKKIWCIIRNKDFYYAELTMTKEELQQLTTALAELNKEEN